MYIGQSINRPRERYALHKSNHLNPNSHEYNSVIHRAMRKYGFNNFEYRILAQEIEDIEILNELEIYYIKFFNCQIPNGYNVQPGGRNASRPVSEEAKEKLRWSHAMLTKDEVIKLRKAYAAKESPKAIYEEKYKDQMHYNSFLNIWTGQRYSSVMPEVFADKGRHTKLNPELVKQIRADRVNLGLSYQKLADKYGVSKAAIADLISGKTWKNVQ